jgi:hypothetical protein
MVNGLPSHRLYDEVVVACGNGVTIKASPDVVANG